MYCVYRGLYRCVFSLKRYYSLKSLFFFTISGKLVYIRKCYLLYSKT